MVDLFNMSQSIGIIIGSSTSTTFGSMFMTLFFILMLLMGVALLFGIKLEFTAILILPLVLGYMAYYSEFLATGIILLIYISIIITKNFIFK